MESALRRPVVRRLLELVRLRNTHPAFDGDLEVVIDGPSSLLLPWSNGDATCSLQVDLQSVRSAVSEAGAGASRDGISV